MHRLRRRVGGLQIRAADADGRLVVDRNGYGTVYQTQAAAEVAHLLANPHPSGCHTEAPGSRDYGKSGHRIEIDSIDEHPHGWRPPSDRFPE